MTKLQTLMGTRKFWQLQKLTGIEYQRLYRIVYRGIPVTEEEAKLIAKALDFELADAFQEQTIYKQN